MRIPSHLIPDRFEVRVRHVPAEGVFIAEAIPVGSPGQVAGCRAKTEEEARARLGRVLDEMARSAREALAELEAMPAATAQAILAEAKRNLADAAGESATPEHRSGTAEPLSATLGVSVADGVRMDAVVIPASARTLRALLVPTPDEVRRAVLDAVVAAAVTYFATQYVSHPADPKVGAGDAGRATAAVVEPPPTPAPPLPRLVTAADHEREQPPHPAGAFAATRAVTRSSCGSR